MLTLATDAASSRVVVDLAEKYASVYAAVGIHPESVREAGDDDLGVIRELARHPKVLAIGEIGLDYYWDKTTADLQQKFFEQQLELAAEFKLPVAVHDRDAHAGVIGTLTNFKQRRGPGVHGVLHAFSGDLAMANMAFGLGFAIGLGGPITFKNNKTAPDLVSALPLENLVVETDAPYLAPHPWRGKRNEPAHVIQVVERIAEFQRLSGDAVAAQTTSNALALFRLR
jgi:TatD DNase family protein